MRAALKIAQSIEVRERAQLKLLPKYQAAQADWQAVKLAALELSDANIDDESRQIAAEVLIARANLGEIEALGVRLRHYMTNQLSTDQQFLHPQTYALYEPMACLIGEWLLGGSR